MELAKQAGLVLDPWQAATLEDALGERADGRWAALEVAVVVPRQNGKGAILEARELAGLFLFEEGLIVHSAHLFDTAREHFLRLWSLIESNADLERRVTKKLENNNGMLIQVGKSRLKFSARKTSQGRGFSGDCVIFDEAFELPLRAMSSVFPTLSARPNPQVWYTSSAPLDEEGSDVLRSVCRQGRAGTSERLCYLEWCAESEDDPDAVQQANPGYGIRLNDEVVDAERVRLGEDFPRERLGIWRDTDDAYAIIPADDWRACRDERSGPGDRIAFALDVSPERDQAAFAVAGPSKRGGVHVEIVDSGPGTAWLVPRAKQLQDSWGAQLAVAANSPAAALLGELAEAGVEIVEVSTAEHAQACGQFFDAVVQHRLRHLGQPVLDAAVMGADRKFYGDAWLWSRRTSVGITPLVAVTLALWLQGKPKEEHFRGVAFG